MKFVKKLLYKPKKDTLFVKKRIHHMLEGIKNRLYYTRQTKTEQKWRKHELAKLNQEAAAKKSGDVRTKPSEDVSKVTTEGSAVLMIKSWWLFFTFFHRLIWQLLPFMMMRALIPSPLTETLHGQISWISLVLKILWEFLPNRLWKPRKSSVTFRQGLARSWSEKAIQTLCTWRWTSCFMVSN